MRAGEVVGNVGAAVDITERRAAEQLRCSAEHDARAETAADGARRELGVARRHADCLR